MNVIYSSGANQFWHQDSPDVEDMAEAGDNFGFRLAAGDFNGKCGQGFCPPADLVIGVYLEDVGTIKDAGAVNVIYGSYPYGLSPTFALPDQFWHQDK